MSNKVIKILSIVTTIVGIATTLLSDYIQGKKLDRTIAEKVAEAVGQNGK